jgi:hypothetical protein
MRRLTMLAADVIDVGVAVVTAPAKWAAQGLRWCATRGDEKPEASPPPEAPPPPAEPKRPPRSK